MVDNNYNTDSLSVNQETTAVLGRDHFTNGTPFKNSKKNRATDPGRIGNQLHGIYVHYRPQRSTQTGFFF